MRTHEQQEGVSLAETKNLRGTFCPAFMRLFATSQIDALKLLFFAIAVMALVSLPKASRRFTEITLKGASEA